MSYFRGAVMDARGRPAPEMGLRVSLWPSVDEKLIHLWMFYSRQRQTHQKASLSQSLSFYITHWNEHVFFILKGLSQKKWKFNLYICWLPSMLCTKWVNLIWLLSWNIKVCETGLGGFLLLVVGLLFTVILHVVIIIERYNPKCVVLDFI